MTVKNLTTKLRARAMRYGWIWHNVEIERLAEITRHNGVYRCLRVNDLEICVSPSGRTRVFKNGEELRTNAAAQRESARQQESATNHS